MDGGSEKQADIQKRHDYWMKNYYSEASRDGDCLYSSVFRTLKEKKISDLSDKSEKQFIEELRNDIAESLTLDILKKYLNSILNEDDFTLKSVEKLFVNTSLKNYSNIYQQYNPFKQNSNELDNELLNDVKTNIKEMGTYATELEIGLINQWLKNEYYPAPFINVLTTRAKVPKDWDINDNNIYITNININNPKSDIGDHFNYFIDKKSIKEKKQLEEKRRKQEELKKKLEEKKLKEFEKKMNIDLNKQLEKDRQEKLKKQKARELEEKKRREMEKRRLEKDRQEELKKQKAQELEEKKRREMEKRRIKKIIETEKKRIIEKEKKEEKEHLTFVNSLKEELKKLLKISKDKNVYEKIFNTYNQLISLKQRQYPILSTLYKQQYPNVKKEIELTFEKQNLINKLGTNVNGEIIKRMDQIHHVMMENINNKIEILGEKYKSEQNKLSEKNNRKLRLGEKEEEYEFYKLQQEMYELQKDDDMGE